MRLIDADSLIEWLDSHISTGESDTNCWLDNIKRIIDSQPTAYDVDKVVEESKEHAIEFEAFGQCSDYVELSHMIGIVKRGGVTVK